MPKQECRRAGIWDVLCWTALAALGFLAVWFYAEGTSPIVPDRYVWDSALFQVIGKLWADGLTPYADIFDHKGPLLFLVQKLAYHFSQPRWALYMMESLMVSVSLGLGYQCLRLKKRPAWAFAGAVLMLVFWLPTMEYGNLCETHSMPWIMLALYLQLRYLTSGRIRHPWPYAFVYGLCFGANMMIRPNNGILIAAVTLSITLQLAWKKEWKNILGNALALVAGVLMAVLPFVIWFWMHGALQEMIYATWSFNLLYAKSHEFALGWQGLRNVLFLITPAMLCLFLAAVCALRRRWTTLCLLVLSAVSTLLITLSGIGYAHYFMLHVPLIPLALYEAHELRLQGKGWRWVTAGACVGFALLCVRTTLPYAVGHVLQPPAEAQHAQEMAYDDLVGAICANIPAQEHDRVAVCGMSVSDAELFLKTDLHPVGRYCFLVDWHARADRSVRTHLEKILRSGEAKWLIARAENVDAAMRSLIDECFSLHSEHTDGYTVYHLYQWNKMP